MLFVAGAGRSGTSTMAGLMQIMGLHVPQPEVVADETNPKGFGEPRWVVDHHDRLLKEAGVQVSDARPEAWFETGRVATREHERIRTAEWLEGHFAVSHELVVKDPRLSWFLGLWRVAAIRTGATPVFATMLRAAGRGGRQQADLLRQPARLGAPRRQLAEHAAAHRARPPASRSRTAAGSSSGTATCSTTGPDVVDAASAETLPAAARAARQQRADPRRATGSSTPGLRRMSQTPRRTSTCRRGCTS